MKNLKLYIRHNRVIICANKIPEINKIINEVRKDFEDFAMVQAKLMVLKAGTRAEPYEVVLEKDELIALAKEVNKKLPLGRKFNPDLITSLNMHLSTKIGLSLVPAIRLKFNNQQN